MAIASGNSISATDFNAVVVAVNKYWGDNYPSSAVTDSDKTNAKYGWGQTHALELTGSDDRVTANDLVEAKHINQLIARANATGLHLGLGTSLSYKIIGNTVTPADANAVNTRFSAATIDALNDTRSTAILGQHTVGSGNTTSSTLGTISRTSTWAEILVSEQTISFTNYAHARYFFNSGGGISLVWDITGGSGTETANWDANLAGMGTIIFLADDVVNSGTGGYSTPNVGFYGLTTSYQLMYSYSFGDGVGSGYMSSAYFSGGDVNAYLGGGAYQRGGYLKAAASGSYAGTYAINRISVYGKYSNNGEVIHLKCYLQTPDDATPINGTLSQTLGYISPNNQVGSGGTGAAAASTTFSINSYKPTGHVFTNDFSSGDDR